MSFICSLKTWRPQHPAFIDDCCQSWIFLVGNFFLIYMYSTCSYLALVGSNYLVGWNDCTKSKLMKKSTTWYYCTHTCNADMTRSDRILRTYNPSNVTMPKESTWYNISKIWPTSFSSADVHSMKMILIWWRILFSVVTQKCCLKLGGCISTDV